VRWEGVKHRIRAPRSLHSPPAPRRTTRLSLSTASLATPGAGHPPARAWRALGTATRGSPPAPLVDTPRHTGYAGVVLQDAGPLLEGFAEVLGLPDDAGLFKRLDGSPRDVSGRDVVQVTGQAGRELRGHARQVGGRKGRKSSALWARIRERTSSVIATFGLATRLPPSTERVIPIVGIAVGVDPHSEDLAVRIVKSTSGTGPMRPLGPAWS
jgi:hypothetical protein